MAAPAEAYKPAVLVLATQYSLDRRLIGSKKQLYGQGRFQQITGMRARDNFG